MTDVVRKAEIVSPSQILAQARANSALRSLSDKLLDPTLDVGTPSAKMRIGWVDLVDYDNWVCRAYIGNQTVPLPGIPMAGNARPVPLAQGVFLQVGNEYTLVGMLTRDTVGGAALGGSDFRIRKDVDEVRTNVSTTSADTELKFTALAGRSYLVDIVLLVTNSTDNTACDLKYGFVLPTGASWSGGGSNADLAITAMNGAPNWLGTLGAVSGTLSVGLGPGANVTNFVNIKASVKMGTTSGLVSFAWSQNSASPTVTTVRAGSSLKADITSEITA